ncbi:toll/interleukin-1 receptor domain-containing protein [Streptomyces sp. NPDC046197]|uniref:toll/interleukin-1 receptor domain-containing protein n=1 Tax=Streptomyces sp. NPDC046197 TaxID=3154337 RepID=UPI00340F3AB5
MSDEGRERTSTYDAFISYNSADREVVQRLAEKVREAGFRVFLDIWSLVPGDIWYKGLERAVDGSPCCLVMCGPTGLGPWQSEEVEAAVRKRVDDTMRVIPVLLPGASDTFLKSHRFLGGHAHCDFRQGLEHTGAFERLCAGIRGEPPGPPARSPSSTAREPAQAEYRLRFDVRAGNWQRHSVVDTALRAAVPGAAPVVLYGLPGMGKTTVLCDVADGCRSDRTVLALTAGRTAAVEPRYLVEEVNAWLGRTFGRGLAAEELYALDWADALAALLGQVAHERLLVLLDDLGTGPFARAVLKAFSALPECLVLSTARSRLDPGRDVNHVFVPPMSREESVRFIAHLARTMRLPVDPEEMADQLPPDVLSHPLALRAFLAHTQLLPAALLVRPELPSDVLSARAAVAAVVAQLPAAHRTALAYAAVLDGVPSADFHDERLPLPPGFRGALPDLAGRCLVGHTAQGLEVPGLVVQALDDVAPSARPAAVRDIASQLAVAVRQMEDSALPLLARVTPPVALSTIAVGEWQALRETFPAGFLDRLNSRGFWKEYVLLAKALIAAADHLRDDDERVRLRIRVSRKVAQLGDTRSAWDLAHEAEEAARWLGSSWARADLAGLRAFLFYIEGEDTSALAELKVCIDLRSRDGDGGGLLIAHKLRGNLHLRRGKYKKAAAAYRAALEAGGEKADARHRIDAETSLAMCELRQGLQQAAVERLERAVRDMRALSLHSELPRALHALALVYDSQGLSVKALQWARQAAAARPRDPAVRAAVDRLLWRLENLGAGPGGRTDQGDL